MICLSLTYTLVFLVLNSNCDQSLTVLNNVRISYYYSQASTYFLVTSPLGNGVSANNAWLAVGLNTMAGMENADVVVCTNLLGSTSIQRYRNIFKNSVLMDSINPNLGLSNTSLVVNGDNMQCSFTRDNINGNQYHFNINNGTQAYVLAAYGVGAIANHGNNKFVTTNTYTFSTKPTTANSAQSNHLNKHFVLILLSSVLFAFLHN